MTTAGGLEPSVGELLGALARDTGVLVRQEVQLASNEMAKKTSAAAQAAGVVAAGGAFAHAGLIGLMGALCLGLGTMVPLWLSAAIVGIAAAVIGYALVQKGLGTLKKLSPVPEQTVQTLKDDAIWAKEQVR